MITSETRLNNTVLSSCVASWHLNRALVLVACRSYSAGYDGVCYNKTPVNFWSWSRVALGGQVQPKVISIHHKMDLLVANKDLMVLHKCILLTYLLTDSRTDPASILNVDFQPVSVHVHWAIYRCSFEAVKHAWSAVSNVEHCRIRHNLTDEWQAYALVWHPMMYQRMQIICNTW